MQAARNRNGSRQAGFGMAGLKVLSFSNNAFSAANQNRSMVPLQAKPAGAGPLPAPQAGSAEGEPADRDHAMNRDELHAKAVRLERELRETRELLRRACHDPGAFTAELVRTRAYAFDAARPAAEVVSGCADSLDRYGFCVIDSAIPKGEVEAVREEVAAAREVISRNIEAIRELSGKDAPPEGAGGGVEAAPGATPSGTRPNLPTTSSGCPASPATSLPRW